MFTNTSVCLYHCPGEAHNIMDVLHVVGNITVLKPPSPHVRLFQHSLLHILHNPGYVNRYSTVHIFSLMMQFLSTANIIDSLTGKLSPRDQEHTQPTLSEYFLRDLFIHS